MNTLQPPAGLRAFGQTWHFTAEAMACLAPYGIRSPQTLKAAIINLTSSKGLEEGVHEMEYLGVELKIYVRGKRVVVDDRYAQSSRSSKFDNPGARLF